MKRRPDERELLSTKNKTYIPCNHETSSSDERELLVVHEEQVAIPCNHESSALDEEEYLVVHKEQMASRCNHESSSSDEEELSVVHKEQVTDVDIGNVVKHEQNGDLWTL